MAGSNKRDLFLQVSATVDPFQRAMKAARGTLLDFSGDVTAQLKQIEANFSALGSGNVESGLRTLEANFNRTFSAIKAKSAGGIDASGIIDVAGAQRAALAAEREAAAIRTVADAAALAAIKINDVQSVEAQYARASLAQALAAEESATALRSQATALERVQVELGGFGAAQGRVTTQTSAQKLGFRDLSFQIGDVATQFTSGTPALTIFAQQGGQVVQAIGLMSGEAKGFIGFLGGPWGQILTAATIVITPLVAKLYETADAAKLATLGSDGLSEAQSSLGKIFDLTSGKLQHQNELLRLNATLTGINLRAESLKEAASSKKVFDNAGKQDLLSGFHGIVQNPGQGPLISFFEGSREGRRNAANLTNIVKGIRSGKLDLDTALKLTETQSFQDLSTTREEFQQAIVDFVSSKAKGQTADEVKNSLKDGVLDPALRTDPPKGRKTADPAIKSANLDASFQNALDRSQQDLAKIQAQLADTAEARYKVAIDELDAESRQSALARADEVTAGKISQAQANQLQVVDDKTTALKKQKALEDLHLAKLQQSTRAGDAEFQRQAELLQIGEQLAGTQSSRRKIALDLLDIETEMKRRAGQALAGEGFITGNADKFREGLAQVKQADAVKALSTKDIKLQTADPLESYSTNIHKATDDINTALKRVEVDGFQNLADGSSRAVGTAVAQFLHLSGVIGNFVEQATSDLARLAIEKYLILPLLGLSGGGVGVKIPGAATGLIPGYADGIIRGPGTGTSDSILALLGNHFIRVSNGESIMTARATHDYGPVLKAMNAGTLPGFASGTVPSLSYPAIPSVASLAPANGHDRQPINIDLRGAVMTEDLIKQMEQIANTKVSQGIIGAAPSLIEASKIATVQDIQRRRL